MRILFQSMAILGILMFAGCNGLDLEKILVKPTPETPTPSPQPQWPDASVKPVVLDPNSMRWETKHVDLFLSSAFYKPKTRGAARLYDQAFDDHYAARLSNFGWNLHQSKDPESFIATFREWGKRARFLEKTHQKIVFDISLMPKWLSVSDDEHVAEGWWCNYHGHSPKDYETWSRIVTGAVEVFRQFENVERYYEVWNEPDLHFWQEGVDEYLKLYEVTVKAIKAADPDGKVGGSAINAWSSKLAASPDREMLNIELIRFAKRRNLPLDFVSWHHFSSDANQILKAKETYEKACREAGYQVMPEWVVSEWNVNRKLRGTPYTAGFMADAMLGLFKAGMSIQTVSTWEDFNPDAGASGYGLITQKGEKKPAFYVHRFFDRLARDHRGVSVMEKPYEHQLAGKRSMIVARKPENVYEIVVWENGYDQPIAAAVDYLLENGVSQEDLKRYGAMDDLRKAIREGRAKDQKHGRQFAEARKIYRAQPERSSLYLKFNGFDRVEVLSAESVRETVRERNVETRQNELFCDFQKFEVLTLKVRLK